MLRLFAWENTNIEFAVYLEYDHLVWAGTPKNDPRGEGFTHQPIDDFLRAGAPGAFVPPPEVQNALRDFLVSEAWRQVEQWETCVVTVDRINRNTEVTQYAYVPHFERHPGIDEALVKRLLEKIRSEGWEFVETYNGQSMSSHSFRRRWQI